MTSVDRPSGRIGAVRGEHRRRRSRARGRSGRTGSSSTSGARPTGGSRCTTTPICPTAGPSSSCGGGPARRPFPTCRARSTPCGALGVNVEIKNLPRRPGLRPFLRHRRRRRAGRVGAGAARPILVSSFHPGTLDRLRAIEPSVETALLTFLLDDPRRRDRIGRRGRSRGPAPLRRDRRRRARSVVSRARARGERVDGRRSRPHRRARRARRRRRRTNVPDVAARSSRRRAARPRQRTSRKTSGSWRNSRCSISPR